MPTFSIVIPSRNRPQLLSTAIQSVLSNTYGSFEIIVADNSDIDLRLKTNPDIADNIEGGHPSRVKILPPPSRGRLSMWDNWSRGAKEAKGDYVIMMPDKCIMSPHGLDVLLNSINAAPEGVITYRIPIKYSFSPRRKPGNDAKVYTAAEVQSFFHQWDATGEMDVYPHGCNCCYKRYDGHHIMYQARNPDYLQGYELVFKQQRSVYHTLDDIMYIPRNIPNKYSVGASYNNNVLSASVFEYRADCIDIGRPAISDYTYDNVIEDFNVGASADGLFRNTSYFKAGLYRAAVDRLLAGGGLMKHEYLSLGEFDPRAALITGKRLIRDAIRRFV